MPDAAAQEDPEARRAEDDPEEEESKLPAREPKEEDAGALQSRLVSESMATVIARMSGASSPAAMSTP